MRNLIINADDFGLHTDINQAIIQAHQEGCLTSTSLMPTGNAFSEAVDLSFKNPTLGIGVHLTLVAEKPMLDPAKVKSLVDQDGFFFKDYTVFIKKYVMGTIDFNEVAAEFTAQIEHIRSTGIAITHLDSHQHLHVLPKITNICLTLAKQYNIKKMRIPEEAYFFSGGYQTDYKRIIGKCGLTFLASLARQKIRKNHMNGPEHFFGMLAGGHMSEAYVLRILKALPEGTSEIMMHPGLHSKLLNLQYGWNYHWSDEYQALISPLVLQYIKDNHVNLISFKELLHE
jgi:hopanoid biosynthesis associated protein HpnK